MKKSQLLLLCFFITTFRADAREVALNYDNVRLSQYQLNEDRTSSLLYTIQAESLHENLSLQTTLQSFNRSGSAQRKHFNNGVLELENSEIHFKHAFYHRGQLIMEQCRGTLHSQPFMANEIIFDISNHQILSPRITFSTGNSIRNKIGYSISINPS